MSVSETGAVAVSGGVSSAFFLEEQPVANARLKESTIVSRLRADIFITSGLLINFAFKKIALGYQQCNGKYWKCKEENGQTVAHDIARF